MPSAPIKSAPPRPQAPSAAPAKANPSARQRKLIGLAASLIAVVVATTALLIALPDDPSSGAQHNATATPHVVIATTPLAPVTQTIATGQWSAFALNFAQAVASAPSDPATLYACGSLGRGDHTVALGISHDGGATWAARGTSISANACQVMVAPGDPHTLALLVATCANGCAPTAPAKLYRSTTSGATLTQAFLPDNVAFSFVAGWAGTTLVAGTMAADHPIAASAANGAFTFADDCLRFIGQTSTAVQALAGANGTIYATLQATSATTPTPVAPTAPLVIQSANGGAVWSLVAPRDGVLPVALLAPSSDGRALFGLESGNEIVTSADGGQTWQTAPTLPNSATFAGFADRLRDGSLIAALQEAASGHVAIYRLVPSAGYWSRVTQLPRGAHPLAATWDATRQQLAIWVAQNGAQSVSVYFA